MVEYLGIVGAGQMGQGIAQVAAISGYNVCLFDTKLDQLDGSLENIRKRLDRLQEKGKITEEDKKVFVARIRKVNSLDDLSDCDLIIEAIVENPFVKKELFKDLDLRVKKDAILASNTSSISITELAAVTSRPSQVVGMHFMNPVPVMKLVEGIRGLETSEESFEVIKTVAEKMGKTFVKANDFPGFCVNRILMPMINEGVYTLFEGVASCEDIDVSMKLGTNMPMGPLELADFIGLDTCLAIMNVLYDGLGDPKYRPCPLLKQYVAAGRFGKKSGRGFYEY